MEDKKIKIDVDVNVKGKKDVDDLGKSLKDTESKSKGLGSTLGELAENSGKLPGAFGEAAEGIVKFGKSFVTSMISATKASLAFIATPIGAILAGIAVAITAIGAAFKGSAEGQKTFSKIMAVISAVTEKFEDLLISLGTTLIHIFEDPKKAIMAFVDLIKTNLINRFTGLLELIPAIGDAINKVFHGDFSGAAKVATNAVAKVATGVEDVVGKTNKLIESTKKWGQEVAEAGKTAAKVADMRSKAGKIERDLIVERAKVEAKVAEAREKAADKENYTAEQRKAYLKEAQKLEDGLYDKEETLYQLRFDAQKLEATYTKDVKENKIKLLEAEKSLIDVQTNRANGARKLVKAINGANKEIAADNKKAAEEYKKTIEKQLDQLKKVEETKILQTQEGSQARIDAEEAANKKIQDFEKQNAKILELTQVDLDAERIKSAQDVAKEKKDLLLKGQEDERIAKEQGEKDGKELADAIEAEYKKEDKLAKKDLSRILNNQHVILQDKLDALEKVREAEISLAKATITDAQELSNTLADINVKADKDEEEAKKKSVDNLFKIAQEGVQSIQNISDLAFEIESNKKNKSAAEEEALAKKKFAVNKALQLSSAIINGTKAITTSLAESPVALGPIPNPAGIASLAFAAISSAAAIGKIAASQYKSSGGGGSVSSPTPNIGSAPAATPSTIQNLNKIGGGTSGFANPNALQGTNKGGSSTTGKTYVVSQDLTNAQNKDAVLKRRASFGPK